MREQAGARRLSDRLIRKTGSVLPDTWACSHTHTHTPAHTHSLFDLLPTDLSSLNRIKKWAVPRDKTGAASEEEKKSRRERKIWEIRELDACIRGILFSQQAPLAPSSRFEFDMSSASNIWFYPVFFLSIAFAGSESSRYCTYVMKHEPYVACVGVCV